MASHLEERFGQVGMFWRTSTLAEIKCITKDELALDLKEAGVTMSEERLTDEIAKILASLRREKQERLTTLHQIFAAIENSLTSAGSEAVRFLPEYEEAYAEGDVVALKRLVRLAHHGGNQDQSKQRAREAYNGYHQCRDQSVYDFKITMRDLTNALTYAGDPEPSQEQ
jgi:ribosomal 50S subunit-associated protein YjgA (DUF615 family)